MPYTPAQLDDALDAYVECAMWASTDTIPGYGDDTWVTLDNYPAHPGLRDALAADLHAFLTDPAVAADLDATGLAPEVAGHDFWLTRNGHGTGFWDRGLGAAGDRLTAAAHVYGDVNLYLDTDLLVRAL